MKKIKPVFGLVLGSFLLSSCGLLGPTYSKPEVNPPKKWAANKDNELAGKGFKKSNIDLAKMAWWEGFNDPRLNDLMNKALANNNDIQVAIGNITVAAGNLEQVHMAWVPTVGLSGRYITSNAYLNNRPALLPNLANPVITNIYGAGLVPSYSLNIFQQIAQQRAANAGLDSAIASKNAVRLAVINQVVGSYFTLSSLHEQLNLQKQLISDLEAQYQLAKTQYSYGLIDQTQLNSYQENLLSAKVNLPAIKDNIVHTNNALSVLISQNPESVQSVINFNKVNSDQKIPLNIPSSVLNARPDIIQAEASLRQANANIGVARSNFFPSISLTSPIGALNAQVLSLFSANADFWMTQITANMPILNLGLYGLIKQANGQYYVAYYNYVKTVKGAFSDVDNQLSSYIQSNDALAYADHYYEVSYKNYIYNQTNYHYGKIGYPQTFASKIDLDNVSLLKLQTKLQVLQSIAGVYQSMAAGYDYKNTDCEKKSKNK